jgi:uncharacterized membrane protein
MDRASLAERIWYDSAVPVFLERFILPALATVLIGVILLNPLKFDWQQQISLAIAVVALAYFVGHTVHRTNEARDTLNPPTRITGPATTSGPDSPAITGDGNTLNQGTDKDKK